jgi:DNA (cytosine-5)-methyltransferase 1
MTAQHTFIDCFAGAGGLSLGMSQAGFESLYAFDSDEVATQTHLHNSGGNVECRRIEEVDPLALIAGVGAPDVIVGGPPCQGFSTQGIGSPVDQRNDLVAEYFRFALAIRPRVIVMENVPGVLGARGRRHMKSVFELLELSKYEVVTAVIDARAVGVPQRRRRALVVAWDSDRAKPFDVAPLLAEGPGRTVRDAIGGLPSPPTDFSEHLGYPNHARARISAINLERISHVPQGGGRLDIPEDLRLACHRDNNHRHLDVYGRLSWDQPAGTITAMFDNFTRGRFAHPDEDRNITNREGARLQTFPDSYVFLGPKKKVARQIGNAVPPALAEAIGRQVALQLVD